MSRSGPRDLSLIRESGSTARVLNLSIVYERHRDKPEYEAAPFFRNKRLNRALVLKHALRGDERPLFRGPRVSATKIVLPFAAGELQLGGVSFMVDQIGFDRAMREGLGGYDGEEDYAHDCELLQLLDALPSFDPFLMRERMRHWGAEPARIYFDVSEADVSRMRAFAGAEIEQLVRLAFAGAGEGGRELAQRLADKLMTDDTARALDPLREVLRMTGEDYREGVFAWKGFLYYKWLVRDLPAELEQLKRDILGARINGAAAAQVESLRTCRIRIVRALELAAARVAHEVHAYDTAFAGLAGGDASAFRAFLIEAPRLFVPIGEAIGVIKHIACFWRFRFQGRVVAAMEAAEAIEMFQEFDITLASVELLREDEAPALI